MDAEQIEAAFTKFAQNTREIAARSPSKNREDLERENIVLMFQLLENFLVDHKRQTVILEELLIEAQHKRNQG